MNILDFKKWIGAIKEGIDTNIRSDDKDSKDEITIDNTTYTIRKNKVSTNDVEISDDKLKTDIKNANRAIGDLKETGERFEELRLTGGEDTKISDKILDIINMDEYNKSNKSLFDTITEIRSYFFDKSGSVAYISIPNLNGIFDNEEIAKKVEEIYIKSSTGIGKGEYFLPLLFKDVHKKRPFGTDPYTKQRVKGDNYILNNKEMYNLELKSPNACLNFNKNAKNNIKTELLKNKNKEDVYKRAITSSILNYAKNQQKTLDNLYLCIFEKTVKKGTPKNVLFINLSKINSEVDENSELFKLISINNINEYTKGKNGKLKKDIAYSFSFTYVVNGDDKKIICSLKSETVEESLILSRDNFVNEIYTK